MQVANLQRYLRSLIEPLTAAGAAQKVTADLEKTCVALEPFKDSDFEQVASYLRAAEEYRRTGVLPFPLPKPRQPRASKPATARAPKKIKLDEAGARDLSQLVRQLQDRAMQSETTREALEEELSRLPLAQLEKSAAVAVAKEIGLAVNSRTSLKEAIERIRKAVLGRKEVAESMKV